MKKYTYHVHGMHCPSCEILVEGELKKHASVINVKANLKTKTVEIEGDFSSDLKDLALHLGELIKPFGYFLGMEKEGKKEVDWKDFLIAVPLALLFITAFILFQKTGLVSISPTELGLGAAFVIGLVASLSSCMAVVGGLLLSLSATFSKSGNGFASHTLFHVGRIAGFFVLGGLLGTVGSIIQLGFGTQAILGILVGLFMFALGINLLDVFPWLGKIQIAIPSKFSHSLMGKTHLASNVAPLLIGVVTFFLPCGFTQSVELFALSTGSFWSGAMIMFVYALGTFPVLALISFGAFKLGQKKAYSGVFFKTVGIVVVAFALFNIINSLAVLGVVPPIFSF